MNYAQNYERFSIGTPNIFQRWFIDLSTREARKFGQGTHKIWTLKYLLDAYMPDRQGLRVLDCGAWNGWFLSYDSPAIAEKIALDRDPYFARQLAGEGIRFVHADIETGAIPVADGSIDLLGFMSILEHLGSPQRASEEMVRVVRPGGIVAVVVPDIQRYGFRFWDDVTHKHPFSAASLQMLFESAGFDTLELGRFNHDLFVASFLLPEFVRPWMKRLRGKLLLYVGRRTIA